MKKKLTKNNTYGLVNRINVNGRTVKGANHTSPLNKRKVKKSFLLKSKNKTKDPTILEIYETIKNKRTLVGFQHYNPETRGFMFIFDKAYPQYLRGNKRKELTNLSKLLDIPLEIRE